MRYLLALLLFWSASVFAGTCFPQSIFFYPLDDSSTDGITKTAFDAQLDLILAKFQPEAQALGYNIVFNRDWKDGTVNSDTYTTGSDWVIDSYGGLARFKGMTADGFLAVACHELGHHLGGAPLYSDQSPWGGGGPSVEGEADYFTTLRCLKELGLSTSRVRAASHTLANVLAALGGEPKPDATKPDPSVVSQTYEDHPAAQCRLDTYLEGSDCPDRGALSNTDPTVNACNSGVGARPLCWFKP